MQGLQIRSPIRSQELQEFRSCRMGKPIRLIAPELLAPESPFLWKFEVITIEDWGRHASCCLVRTPAAPSDVELPC